MTDCSNGDIRDLLPDLLHGKLGGPARAEVEAHLRECAECREELELLRSLRSALRRVPAVDVDGIAASIPQYRAPARQVASRSGAGWRVAAAITLLAVGGTSVVVARNGEQAPASVAGVAPTAARELALTGGSIGELDDNELSALIDDIGSLNAVTPTDVDNAAAVGPIAPTSPSGTNN